MNDYIKSLCNLFGINLSHSMRKEEVLTFIEGLWPQNSNLKLIRLGPNGDGGYLIPDDLDNIEACFSPGVDLISDFEQACYDKGMQIFLADKSVNKPNLKIPEDEYHFVKKFIGTINNEDLITMDSWINSASIGTDSDLLLQMDIEGHEYSSILSMSNELMKRFRIIVIEFHELNKLWNKDFFRLAESVFLKLMDTHICLHIHPNNESGIEIQRGVEIPRIAEFTFVRKDRVKLLNYATEFPHKFDFDNSNKKRIVLPKIWYKN